MKNLFLFTIAALFLFVSCDKKSEDGEQKQLEVNKPFNATATVLGKGQDCGAFLIRFDDDVANLPNNGWDNIYYASNLPEEYKVEGIEINAEFRNPEGDEFMACTAFGPGYPQIHVVKVNYSVD